MKEKITNADNCNSNYNMDDINTLINNITSVLDKDTEDEAQTGMTDEQLSAFLVAIKIMIEECDTKEKAIANLERIINKLK